MRSYDKITLSPARRRGKIELGVACCPRVCSQLFKVRHEEETIAKHALGVHSSPACQFDPPAGRIGDVAPAPHASSHRHK